MRVHADLPIFRLEEGPKSVLYVPGLGYSVSPSVADGVCAHWRDDKDLSDPTCRTLAAELETVASRAHREWLNMLQRPYMPVCLTVYPTLACNLACRYCFSANARSQLDHSESWDHRLETVAVAIAEHCAAAGRPLTVVLHGGGEPTLRWERMTSIVEVTRNAAHSCGVGWFGYLATNGVLPQGRVDWLAENFDRIGLSCDGPPFVQDRNRPTASGGGSSRAVLRTAQRLLRRSKAFDVRATITPETMCMQTDVARFFVEDLGARNLRFEPSYGVSGGRGADFQTDDAPVFAWHYLQARDLAARAGADLALSGVRPGHVHGPYCNHLRQVAQFSPDGSLSACFGVTGATATRERGLSLPLREGDAFADSSFPKIRRLVLEPGTHCKDCFNVYHCARECPERCALAGESVKPGFRCGLLKLVGRNWIVRHATDWTPEPTAPMATDGVNEGHNRAAGASMSAATRALCVDEERCHE